MDARQATQTLEVIRTLMERATQYQFLTARAGLAAGSFACVGALAFLFLDPADPRQFGALWAVVFVGSVLATVLGTMLQSRQADEPLWSRQSRTVLAALTPSLLAALALSVLFFALDLHLWLPGVWMLCYGQGALATASYAPPPICPLGWTALIVGSVTLALGPAWGVLMMGLMFGVGHIALGIALLAIERRQSSLKLHREVA